MAFKGNVESFSLADVFQNLAMNSQTGTLRITPTKTPDAEEKYVYFQDGHVRFLSGSSRAPMLPPEVFFARGLITKTEFDEALLQQTETNESQLSNVLMNMGLVTEQQIQDLLVHQIHEEMYDLFGWEAAAFEFNEGPPPEGLFAAEAAGVGWGISIQVAHLIMEAARRVDEWERLRAAIPSQKEIFVVDLTVRKAIERGAMETDPVERRVAMLIDGARDVEDIVDDSKLFKFEVYSALSGFLQSSIIRPATLNELNFSEGECARLELPRRRVKVLERILALGGENLRIRRELADMMSKLNQAEHACIHYNILAAAEMKEGREDGAIDIYKRILTLAPTNVLTRESLAKLYAKRGQKRDAYTQYTELFDTLRDQHQLREAREAAVHALENDPTSVKMRNALVELLLMDDLHEEASYHLEQLGDIAARSRNSALAADAYRRAMQYRKNIRPLKKKLNEVLLTKEDKIARSRRLMLSAFFLLAIVVSLGFLAWQENENKKKYDAAEGAQRDALLKVEDLMKVGDTKSLEDARLEISRAMDKLSAARKLWSPAMNYNVKAEDLYLALKRTDENTDKKIKSYLKSSADKREDNRKDAKIFFDNKNYLKAREFYRALINDPGTTPLEKVADEKMIRQIESVLAEYEIGLKKLEQLNRNPERAFNGDARSEFRFITEFKSKYINLDKFPQDLRLPVLVKSELDDVSVWLDGNLVSVIKRNSSDADRTFRYPLFPYSIPSAHVFKFTKNGYTTQEEPTTMHQAMESVTINVNLKRQFKTMVKLANAHFEGGAIGSNGHLYAGTTEGSLVEIEFTNDAPRISARYELQQPMGGVNKEVFGQIFIHKSPGRPDLYLFCTKAGYCAGVVKNGTEFESAWKSKLVKIPDLPASGMEFAPTYFMQGGKPVIVVMTTKKAIRIDGETGEVIAHAPTLEMPSFANNVTPNATSGACFVDKNGGMLIVGGSDSNLHVMFLDGHTPQKKWESGQAGKGFFVQTAPFLVDDLVIAAGNEGTVIPFKSSGFKLKEKFSENGAASAPPAVLGFKAYIPCVGSEGKEGLTMVDLGAGDNVGPRNRADKGINLTPALLEKYKRLYYINNQSVVRCIDTEDVNKEYWSFDIGHATKCPPIIEGTRLYVLTTDGFVFSFEEPN